MTKKKIKSQVMRLCKLITLSRADRKKRASELYHDNDYKQKMCNRVPGLKLDALDAVLAEIAEIVPDVLKSEQESQVARDAERDQAVEMINRHKKNLVYSTYSEDEVRVLVKSSRNLK